MSGWKIARKLLNSRRSADGDEEDFETVVSLRKGSSPHMQESALQRIKVPSVRTVLERNRMPARQYPSDKVSLVLANKSFHLGFDLYLRGAGNCYKFPALENKMHYSPA